MSPRSIKSSKTLKTEHEIIFLQLWNTAWSFSRSHVCFIILYHWPKLYVDIIFTSRVLFLSNLWELWQTDYTTFGEDISNELFLSYSKIRRHCCSGSWVILETIHHNPYYSALLLEENFFPQKAKNYSFFQKLTKWQTAKIIWDLVGISISLNKYEFLSKISKSGECVVWWKLALRKEVLSE